MKPSALRFEKSADTTGLSREDLLLWSGALLALVPLLMRATSNMTTFPAWDLDPLTYAVSSTAITPSVSMMCDAVSLTGSTILMLWAVRRGVSVNLSLVLLAIIGAVAVVLHGWVIGPHRGGLDHQRIGGTWLSAMLGAVAVWHAAQDTRCRRLLAAILLGLVFLLATYGAVQVYFVHPQTVAEFQADPNRMLAAHGWTPDSPMAKSFIRRLTQPEASAWFGLSNVYASFAAAGFVGGLAMLIAAPVRRTSVAPGLTIVLLLVLLTLAGAAALFLAHSKGGYVAAAGGAIAALLLVLIARAASVDLRKARRVAGYVGLLAFIGPIGMIMARGMIGERSGELSLLFRSFYAQAAVKIFIQNPVVGVGPDGFQRAFTLAKPALCPEEVSSPHCIPFDYAATLGVLGIAWICVFLRLAFQIGANSIVGAVQPEPEIAPKPSAERSDTRLLLLIPAAATILAAYMESPMIAPEIALVRVAGLIGWLGCAWAVLQILSIPYARIGLAGGALALIAHAQIDVTASFVPSCGLWALFVATAAAPTSISATASETARTPRPNGAAWLLPGVCLLLAGLAAFTSLTRVRAWEWRLNAAAEIVRPLADISDRLAMALRSTPPSREQLDRVVKDLATAVGHSVQPTEVSVNAARAELEQRLLPDAISELERTYEIYPDDRQALREASRLHMRLAEHSLKAGKRDLAAASYAQAVRVLRLLPSPAASSPVVPDPLSSEWHWLAVVQERQADALEAREPLVRATEARLNVASIDPYSLDNAIRLFRDYQKLGDAPHTKAWAAKCLELDRLMRLDPLVRGLVEKDRADVERAAGTAASP